MKFLLWLSLFLIVGLTSALAGAVYLAVENQPRVNRTAEFTPDNIERAKRILDKNDPRRIKPGILRTIAINQEDLDLAANYLANRYGRGSAQIVLQGSTAFVRASVELPPNPLGRYVNVDAALSEAESLPRFDRLSIGRLPVPPWLADWALARMVAKLNESDDFRFANDVIRKVSVAGGRLSVVYAWQSDLPEKLRAVALPREEQERLRAYHARLGEASRSVSARQVPLADLMQPLFQLARERSRGGDAAAENRALILVLAFYINGKGLGALVPAAKDWPRAAAHTVTLNARQDFPQHFTISAALAAHAGGPLADAVGLYKEVDDSRGGSGFSFNDIAADRAGTRFGEIAVARGSAAKLQERLAAGVRERDLMPETADLPEFMPEPEFKRRFGGIGAPAYKQMMAEIERRVLSIPLYR